MRFSRRLPVLLGLFLAAFSAASLVSSPGALGDHSHVTKLFSGAKVNGGTATHTRSGNTNILTLSDDFKIPDTPAPHWQVVDSRGNVYLLQRLKIKGDKVNKSIKLPSYIADVARVEIWCAWAESLLGAASFSTPVK